jgi:ectoine hydroxylase-related dioxygenase (phytanoyl-CoA dioxygenase family)
MTARCAMALFFFVFLVSLWFNRLTVTDPGYSISQEVIGPEECDVLLSRLADLGQQHSRAGARHMMSHPAVRALAQDPRLIELGSEALGHPATPYRATLFEKSSRADWLVPWHQDTALPLVSKIASSDWGPWSAKQGILYAHAPSLALQRVIALRIHLDRSTQENGPLRVIPGTHLLGVLDDEDIASLVREKESVECLTGRGGVVAMRPLILHASSKVRSDEPRRVIHIEYADSLDLGPGVTLAIA